MGLYDRYVLPRLVTCACGTRPILKQRQKIVPRARGTVLEIGLGGGHNLPHYAVEAIERVIGVDPCEASWQLAQPKVNAVPFDVDFLAASAEDIPLPEHSVDAVLMTFSLCTIPDPMAALAEARRVLKPGGELVFCEHGKAPDPDVVRWQNRVNPLWRRLFGGCHLNRDILELLDDSGFATRELEQMYLPGTPRIAGYNVWGVAHPR
ncbi:MAG: class I SAM-dependent methyltransferase [Halieaceae bacterium]|jgi:ubiquinone/menaquinone biosynthesis C-methylase UbiE|nr:class I SAM-dependent methyltransferase [Halieaceae bacterium]